MKLDCQGLIERLQVLAMESEDGATYEACSEAALLLAEYSTRLVFVVRQMETMTAALRSCEGVEL
jgi:hypothetical protein